MLVVACLMLFTSNRLQAQIMETKTGVDTLKFAERLSVRTNAVDWMLLTPNIGIEFDILNKNWNRWAVGLSIKSNWRSSHTFKPGMVYNIIGITGEIRNYWRPRQIDLERGLRTDKSENAVPHITKDPQNEHITLIDKLFSFRRKRIKHYRTTYYRGLYGSINKYSIKLGREGKEGTALVGGITYGIVKPLYIYNNGNSIDFEAGFNAGLVVTNYHSYVHNTLTDCYENTDYKKWFIVPYPVISEVRVGLIYRFGKYPIYKKYRWRYDVDLAYKDTLNNRIAEMQAEVYAKRDSLKAAAAKKAAEKMQKRHDDSIAKIERRANDSIAKLNAERRATIHKDSIDVLKDLLKEELKLHLPKADTTKALIDTVEYRYKMWLLSIKQERINKEKAAKEAEKNAEKAKKDAEKERKKNEKERKKAKKADKKDETMLFLRRNDKMILPDERRGRYV